MTPDLNDVLIESYTELSMELKCMKKQDLIGLILYLSAQIEELQNQALRQERRNSNNYAALMQHCVSRGGVTVQR